MEEADEEGCGEQRQEVGHRRDVSELVRRQQADRGGGRGGERADDADRHERGGAVATLVLGLSSAQVDRRGEHEHVHDQVDLCREGGEYPVGA